MANLRSLFVSYLARFAPGLQGRKYPAGHEHVCGSGGELEQEFKRFMNSGLNRCGHDSKKYFGAESKNAT
jgi:hypothetical protein